MIPLQYNQARWFLGLILVVVIALMLFLPLASGALVGFIVLLVATVASAVYPPGLYGWLIRVRCPSCNGEAEWYIEADQGSAYQEVLGFRCLECDYSVIEFEYRPDYGQVQPKHGSEHH